MHLWTSRERYTRVGRKKYTLCHSHTLYTHTHIHTHSVGATGGTTVSYLLPGLTYALLHPHTHTKRILALAQFGLGVVIIFTCLVTIAIKKRE